MNIEIISCEDQSYLDYKNRSAALRKKDRFAAAIDPLQSDLQKAYKALEVATLELLKRTAGAEIDRIIKVLRHKPHPIFGDYDFFELDSILRINDTTICFCEVKITASLHWAFKSARKQLRKRMDLCHEQWGNSYGIAVCFCFPTFESENSTALSLTFRQFVDFLRQPHAPQTTNRVLVNADSLKSFLDEHQLEGTKVFAEIQDLKNLLATANPGGEQPLPRFINPLAQALDRMVDA